MKKYKIEVEEVFQRIIEVEAESLDEAINIVTEDMECGEGLTYEDFIERDVRPYPYED